MTSYFILAKSKQTAIDDKSTQQITTIIPNNNLYYILPRNNLSYHIEHGLFESNLIEWCKQFCHPDKIILDIGGHTGTYALSLASKCKYVLSFEPQKMTYYALCGSVALSQMPNITCFQFGLGSPEQIGKQTLNIVSLDGGGSSIHSPNMSIIGQETIEIKTLDSLNIQEPISFIKMDIEGSEMKILETTQNTFKKLIFEIGRAHV